MQIDFFILTLSLTFILGIPFYLYFRWKMSKNNGKKFYSKIRVIKLTLINILLSLFMMTQLFGIFISILLRGKSLNSESLIISALFIITACLTFYGAGIYAASIIIDNHVSNSKKNDCDQKKAIDFLHGPLSHTMVYGGCVICLLELAILDFISLPSSQFNNQQINVLIWLSGVFWAISAVLSKTHLYQAAVVTISIVIFYIFLNQQKIEITLFPVPFFFFNLCLSFLIVVLSYALISKLKLFNLRL